MKIKELVLATMFCGAFGLFTACSEDINPVTGDDTGSTDPVEKEAETILALSTGIGTNGFSTKASGAVQSDGGNVDWDLNSNTANNLVVALFNVKDGKPTTLIDLKMISKPEEIEGEEGSYYIPPFKFKISPTTIQTNISDESQMSLAKVAVVVLGNTVAFNDIKLLDVENEFKGSTFEEFKSFADGRLPGNFHEGSFLENSNIGISYTSFDGTFQQSESWDVVNSYPMSSNVHVFDLQVGAVNGVGVEKNKALEIVNNTFDTDITEYNESQKRPIDLYRNLAEVELVSLTFKDYVEENMTFDHFVLEEVFMMNVPNHVNWFNAEPITASEWGKILIPSYEDYTKDGFKGLFETGNKRRTTNTEFSGTDATGSILMVPGIYCNSNILNNAKINNLLRFENYGNNMRGEEYKKYAVADYKAEKPEQEDQHYGYYKGVGTYPLRMHKDGYLSFLPQIKFSVAPSNYGLLGKDKAMCLVVKGRYYYKTSNGTVIGSDEYIGKNPYASKYYTVIVNENGDGNKSDHPGEVRRNYRYQISLTINGPGSDTPWDYTKNSYVVPKVTVVPFGVVEQDSKLD